MTDPRYPTHAQARAAGWFSRRHRTDEVHRASVKAWRETHGAVARRRRAILRLELPEQSH